VSEHIFGVDVDGPCADLLPEWLRRYNRDYDDAMTPAHITQWEMERIVKPECGKKIYNYLTDPDLYECVQPVEGARFAIEQLRSAGLRVIFVSSCVRGHTDEKMDWLVRHGFLPDERWPRDFIAATDKHPLKHAFVSLVDDRPENLEPWGSRGILWNAAYNRGYVPYQRAYNWSEVILSLQEILPEWVR
jgi:5'(3')-deoxyribonucleotidase